MRSKPATKKRRKRHKGDPSDAIEKRRAKILAEHAMTEAVAAQSRAREAAIAEAAIAEATAIANARLAQKMDTRGTRYR